MVLCYTVILVFDSTVASRTSLLLIQLHIVCSSQGREMVDAQILLQHYLSILVCEPIAQEFGWFCGAHQFDDF
jgi:hypothetical protein